MAKKKACGKENGFDRLARLIKEEGEDIRTELRGEMREGFASLERKMDERFTAVQRQLGTIIQIQLDQHAGRIKKLESAVFPN
jgi:hypothetical protein